MAAVDAAIANEQGSGLFDTSGLVKLLIKEELGAELAADLLHRSVYIHTSLLLFPETTSALARSRREGRLSEEQFWMSRSSFAAHWSRIYIVDFDELIATHAAELILQYPLSGADAVQLASALSMQADEPLTFVSWDRRQAVAAAALGLAVEPPIV